MNFKEKFDQELFKVSLNLYDSDTFAVTRTLMELSVGRHEKMLKKTKNNERSYRVYLKDDMRPLYIPKKPRTPRVPVEFFEEKETKNGIEKEKRPIKKVLLKDSKKQSWKENKQNEEMGRKRLKLPSEEELRSQGVNLDLPRKIGDFVKEKKGTEPVMVIRKIVYQSDLDTNEGRLSMPMKQLAVSTEWFLTEEEWAKVVGGESIEVRFVDPEFLEVFKMEFFKWNINKSMSCILRSGWNDVLGMYMKNKNKCRGLKIGDIIQVWAFRCNQNKELWFALSVVVGRIEGGSCGAANKGFQD